MTIPDIKFIVPILIQLRLICFRDSRLISLVRKLLILPTIWLALSNTHRGNFDGIGPIGFVWAVTLFVGCLKSVDLGFTHRHSIRYIGTHGQRSEESKLDTSTDLGWSAFFDLLTNLRGVGWAWGYTWDIRDIRGISQAHFLRHTLTDIVKHHFISTFSVALLAHAMDNNDILFTQSIFLSDVAQTLLLGAAAWSGLSLGYSLVSLLVYTYSRITHSHFDPLRWPPLLNDPLKMHSVRDFWSNRWHSLFKRQFLLCGYTPVVKVCRWVGIRDDMARLLGVQGAFLVSALMHEWSIRNALNHSIHPATLPSIAFFQASAAAVALETTIQHLSGRRVGGALGALWAWSFLLLTGIPMMRHWLHGGTLGYVVPPQLWSLKRIVTPFGFLAPADNL
ncbi:hypothetical protein E3P86_03288 [Wallemia ichthyophaga]|uniref:Wax synthase domain-containing protein n=1 Tax=Wallemia ichthyophaga TaxID=245174 RepID=A0A4T0IRH3_WALIC|nr:hypothetical protein E3P86_03288 [Wallemia ichthyophaga]